MENQLPFVPSAGNMIEDIRVFNPEEVFFSDGESLQQVMSNVKT